MDSPFQFHRKLAVAFIVGSLWLACPQIGGAAPLPPTNNTSPPYLGAYGWGLDNGNATQGMAHIASMASWLNRSTFWAEDFSNTTSWASLSNNWTPSKGEEWVKDHPGSYFVYTLGLLPSDGTSTLAAGATGTYNSYFTTIAQGIVSLGLQNNIIIRLGHEFNGNWYAWQVDTDADALNYAAYFRQVVTAMRAVPGASTIKFCWNGSNVWDSYPIADAYPGDAYVDYIALDLYDGAWGVYPWPNDPWPAGCTPAQILQYQQEAWAENSGSNDNGLAVWTSMATAHNKPFAIPEWGLSDPNDHGGGDDPYYIQQMYNFIQDPANNVAFTTYFDVQAGDGLHQLTQLPGGPATNYPNAAILFKQLFGVRPLPTDSDIGTVGISGTSDASNVYGAGTGYLTTGTTDNFHFAYRSSTGNDSLLAEVTSMPSSGAAQRGIMLRQTGTGSGDPYAAVFLANGQCIFQSRTTAGSAAVQNSVVASVSPPAWLKMRWVGNVISGYESADGVNWHFAGSQTVALTGTAYLGLAVASGSAVVTNTTGVNSVGNANIAAIDPGIFNENIVGASPNPTPGLTTAGTWQGDGNSDCYGGEGLVNWAPTTLSTAKFTPTIATAGYYDVYIRWYIASEYEMSDSVQLSIASLSGTTSTVLDEKVGDYLWNYLGTYSFASGSSGNVLLSNSGVTTYGTSDTYSTVNAVMFVPVPTIFAPTVVTGLTRTSGSNAIGLSWAASTGATSYYVERSGTSGGSYTTIATITTTSYADPNVINGTTYYYIIVAVNNGGESTASSQLSALQTGGVPSVPVLSTTLVNTCAVLSWTASPGATIYNVMRSGTSGGPYTTIASPTTNSYNDTTIVNGNPYYYVVAAVNNTVESANSNQTSVMPIAGDPPVPSGVVATPGNTKVTVSWNASPGATSYNIYRSTSGTGPFTTALASLVTTSSFVDTSVTNGTTYYYEVSATNAAPVPPVVINPGFSLNGNGNQLTASQLMNTPPGLLGWVSTTRPTGGSLASDAGDSINTAAAGVSDGPGGKYPGAVFWDLAGYGLAQLPETTNIVIGPGTYTLTFQGEYYYGTPSCILDLGFLSVASGSSGTLQVPLPSGTGTSNDYQIGGPTSALAISPAYGKWATYSGTFTVLPGSSLVGQDLGFFIENESANVWSGLTGFQLSYAPDASVNSTPPSSATPAVAPSAPTGLSVTATNARAYLSWSPSTGATSYIVMRSTASGSGYVTISNPTTTTYTDSPAFNGATYYYVVSASNSIGVSANSAPLSFPTALTFTQWETNNNLSSAFAAAPLGDGIGNGLKYLCDINPSQAMSASNWAALPLGGILNSGGIEYLTLTYRQNAMMTGITINVQTSTDLQSWQTVTPAINQQIGSDPNTGDPIKEVGVNINGATNQFIRLNITSP